MRSVVSAGVLIMPAKALFYNLNIFAVFSKVGASLMF